MAKDSWARVPIDAQSVDALPDHRPGELRSFARVEGSVHAAPSTPGDLLFHIRSERPDFCFELERLLLGSLGTYFIGYSRYLWVT